MHLGVWSLLVSIELFLLVVVQDGSDLLVGLIALAPDFGKSLDEFSL